MVTINLKATGNRIKSLKEASGLTTQDLMVTFGFNNPTAIYKWFRGDTIPTVDNLVILADLFNTTIDEIIVVDRDIISKAA